MEQSIIQGCAYYTPTAISVRSSIFLEAMVHIQATVANVPPFGLKAKGPHTVHLSATSLVNLQGGIDVSQMHISPSPNGGVWFVRACTFRWALHDKFSGSWSLGDKRSNDHIHSAPSRKQPLYYATLVHHSHEACCHNRTRSQNGAGIAQLGRTLLRRLEFPPHDVL